MSGSRVPEPHLPSSPAQTKVQRGSPHASDRCSQLLRRLRRSLAWSPFRRTGPELLVIAIADRCRSSSHVRGPRSLQASHEPRTCRAYNHAFLVVFGIPIWLYIGKTVWISGSHRNSKTPLLRSETSERKSFLNRRFRPPPSKAD